MQMASSIPVPRAQIPLLRQSRLAVPALVLCAAFYIACSVAPWTAALATAHIELYVAS